MVQAILKHPHEPNSVTVNTYAAHSSEMWEQPVRNFQHIRMHSHFLEKLLHTSKLNKTLPCKYIKFEVGNVIIACEVDGGFKGHCLQPRCNWMNFIQKLPEHLPWYKSPKIKHI
jgi:hypothetical protein